MLTQLKKAARLDRLSGLILGTFTEEQANGAATVAGYEYPLSAV
jgi:muramoyltetrapeptide carboxypeptidase LdcA involved in peptidoglycan recycling